MPPAIEHAQWSTSAMIITVAITSTAVTVAQCLHAAQEVLRQLKAALLH